MKTLSHPAITLVAAFVWALSGTIGVQSVTQWNPPDKGVIPDEQTAIRVVEAVLEPIEGPETVAKQRPFKAKLVSDTWTVTGSLRHEETRGMFVYGGTATVELSKARGCVERINLSK